MRRLIILALCLFFAPSAQVANSTNAINCNRMRQRISLFELRRLNSPPRAMVIKPNANTPSVASMAITSRKVTAPDIAAI